MLCGPYVPLCKAFQGVVRPWITIVPVLSCSPPGNVTGQRALDAGVSHPFMLEVGEEVQSVWGHLIYFQMDAFVETSSFPVVLNFILTKIIQEQRNFSDQRGDLIPSSTKKPQFPLNGPRQVLGMTWVELIFLNSEMHKMSLGSLWSSRSPSPNPSSQRAWFWLSLSAAKFFTFRERAVKLYEFRACYCLDHLVSSGPTHSLAHRGTQ